MRGKFQRYPTLKQRTHYIRTGVGKHRAQNKHKHRHHRVLRQMVYGRKQSGQNAAVHHTEHAGNSSSYRTSYVVENGSCRKAHKIYRKRARHGKQARLPGHFKYDAQRHYHRAKSNGKCALRKRNFFVLRVLPSVYRAKKFQTADNGNAAKHYIKAERAPINYSAENGFRARNTPLHCAQRNYYNHVYYRSKRSFKRRTVLCFVFYSFQNQLIL